MLKTLPAKYYLDHFFEFLDFIETHYQFLLSPEELKFIEYFYQLSEDAQCIYIRMVNRKGLVFDVKGFAKYTEITDKRAALDELRTLNFILPLTNKNHLDLLTFLTKPQLLKWLNACGITAHAQLSRDELVEQGRLAHCKLDYTKLIHAEDLLIQGFSPTMQYLMFLYFGRLQKTLTLYTLRDLGIRKSNTLKGTFKPRFKTQQQAHAEYFFVTSLDVDLHWLSESEIQSLYLKAMSLQNLPSTTQYLKDEFLLGLGEFALANEQTDFALQVLMHCEHVDAREVCARTFYKNSRRDECQNVLDAILLNPRSDQELAFAEDFFARKFNKKKLGYLSEILQSAQEIPLSYFYLKRPEEGVCQYYKNQGMQAFFAENKFWCSLFGLLFWNELFESEKAAIHNPFERSPSDLAGEDFYLEHKDSIETLLSKLTDSSHFENYLQEIVAKNYGRLNDIFQWHPDLLKTTLHFLHNSRNKNTALILRTLAKNFSGTHSGFPDLVLEQNGNYSFVEVKAEGDSLRASQLARMRLLQEAGFAVEVLKVRWENDPNQTYVVVDVETTGGSSSFHRITEIGAVKIQNGKIIDEFQTLIHPGRPIPAFITSITGITNEMVADAPSFSQVAQSFLDFMTGSIFVAHNVKFDYGFIQKEFARAEIEFTRPHLCTCAGIKKSYPGLKSYGLKTLTEHFQIPLEQHHRALSDARAAAELLFLIHRNRLNSQDLHL